MEGDPPVYPVAVSGPELMEVAEEDGEDPLMSFSDWKEMMAHLELPPTPGRRMERGTPSRT